MIHSIPLEELLAGAMLVSLTFYALFGGADYGGGIWDLLAWGPRARRQRELIATAIGPIWEANHVWLILVIVILFTAFPPAFAVIATALHIPLTLMLFGIVLRGSAFIFRTYDRKDDDVQRRWGRLFAMASLMTPILLGAIVGTIASGQIEMKNGIAASGFVQPWLAPFPIAVGLFALTLFAFLSAIYLTLETAEEELQEDFRRRGLVAALAVGLLALIVFMLAPSGAPDIGRDLSKSWWTWPLQIATAGMAIGALAGLWVRRYRLARYCAVAQVSLILWGWGLAQFPYLVEPDISIFNVSAPPEVMRLLLWTLIAGAVLLFPSFCYLFYVFKGRSN